MSADRAGAGGLTLQKAILALPGLLLLVPISIQSIESPWKSNTFKEQNDRIYRKQ